MYVKNYKGKMANSRTSENLLYLGYAPSLEISEGVKPTPGVADTRARG